MRNGNSVHKNRSGQTSGLLQNSGIIAKMVCTTLKLVILLKKKEDFLCIFLCVYICMSKNMMVLRLPNVLKKFNDDQWLSLVLI